jgi:hypothetical protein
MTKEEVKIWLLEGEYAVFGCGIFSREVLGEPVMQTESAVLVRHPEFGLWGVTKYGAIFRAPMEEITHMEESFGDLHIYTPKGLVFTYQINTGRLRGVNWR